MEEDKVLKKRKIKLILIESFLIFLIILLAGAIYLLTYQKNYSGMIYPNVQFSDINLGGQTHDQAGTLLDNYNKKIGLQKITIASGEKQTEITFADAGTTLDIDKMLEIAYQAGRDKNFFREIYASARTLYETKNIEPIIKTDQVKFSALIEKISTELDQKATDATIVASKGKISITPSQKGLAIDRNDLIQQIIDIINTQKSRTITAKAVYADPTVVESNLTAAKAQAEGYMAKSATLKTDDQTFQLSGSIIGDFLVFGKNSSGIISANVDNNKIASYVANTLAKKIDIAKVDRKISATNQAVLSEGQDGRHVDRTDAQAKIKNFVSGEQSTAVIALTVIGDVFGDQVVFPNEGVVAGRFSGKYIDIDLPHQQMYLFDGANLVVQYTISSGKWSTPTPVGTRYVINKDPRAWSSPYGLYMPWWQGIGGGYGIHELPEWPGGAKEGESHLGIPVSHGCIRLGVGPAQTVYNFTDIGTPVYIHK